MNLPVPDAFASLLDRTEPVATWSRSAIPLREAAAT